MCILDTLLQGGGNVISRLHYLHLKIFIIQYISSDRTPLLIFHY